MRKQLSLPLLFLLVLLFSSCGGRAEPSRYTNETETRIDEPPAPNMPKPGILVDGRIYFIGFHGDIVETILEQDPSFVYIGEVAGYSFLLYQGEDMYANYEHYVGARLYRSGDLIIADGEQGQTIFIYENRHELFASEVAVVLWWEQRKAELTGPVHIDPSVTLSHNPAVTTFELSALDFAAAMGVGWNLGNSLDAFSNRRANESAWNNPRVVPELFHAIRESGFTTVRIPVTWIGHIDDGNDFAVRESWMARVQEVVGYALDADLYVIINVHHDGNNYFNGGAWLSVENSPHDQTYVRARFAALWRQIAERFREYDARLLFEGFNELRELNNYGDPRRDSSMQNLNALNQLFVDTVRETGGNNAYRYLIVAGYNTNASITLNPVRGFLMPEDTVPDRLMLSIHFYDPWNFTLNAANRNIFRWGEEVRQMRAPGVDSWGNEPHVRTIFGRLHTAFVERGIPILLGEYGVHDKSDIDRVNREYRRYWLEYVTRAMIETGGFVPVIWDNGNISPGGERFGLFDRRNPRPRFEDLIFAVVRAPYAPARPLFSRQVIEESFARHTHDPEIRVLFNAAVAAADNYRADTNLQTLNAVEGAYRELLAAIR
jgi:aryl-phospho-beta-D-glucosidase BglC (GH1 family)